MAEVEIGIGKSARQAYGLDDVAIVPSRRTRDPEDVDISWEIDAFKFELPLMASAMDGVVSPATAVATVLANSARTTPVAGSIDGNISLATCVATIPGILAENSTPHHLVFTQSPLLTPPPVPHPFRGEAFHNTLQHLSHLGSLFPFFEFRFSRFAFF